MTTCPDNPSPRRLNVFMGRAAVVLATAIFIALAGADVSAQIPITYYDFENNTTRTNFENAVEQQINGGSGTISRAGNTTTITGTTGAGNSPLYGAPAGSTAGSAPTSTNWPTTGTDPLNSATNYYQFTANTSGFTGISVRLDSFPIATNGPNRVNVTYSVDGGATFIPLTAVTVANSNRNSWTQLTFALGASADNTGSMTVRVYAFNAGGSAGTWTIDNLQIMAASTTTAAGTKNLLNEPNIYTSTTSGATGNVFNRSGFTATGNTTINIASQQGLTGSGFTVSNNAILQINTGGFFSGQGPTFNDPSFLSYNTGGTYGRGLEWSSTSGPGYPNKVAINGNTTLEMGANGGAATPRQTSGMLSINSGNLQLAGSNPMTAPVTVLGNLNISGPSGVLTLSTAFGGDIKVGGNWSRSTSATFTPNNRAVFFIGTGDQEVAVLNAGIETFNYLVVDKPSGSLVLRNTGVSTTDVIVNGSAGDVLQLLNAGGINLNGRGMTLQNNGGNILASGGARTIGGGTSVSITGSKTVTSASGGTLVFDSATNVFITAGVDFGASLTTVNGKLTLGGSNGAVTNNPPTYGIGSTLVYDRLNIFTRGAEWSAASGPGYPFNVQVNDSAGTELNLGSNSPAVMAGSLFVKTGGVLNLDMSDLNLGGDFTINGTFNHDGQTVTFNGTSPQSINGSSAITFHGFSTASGASVSSAVSFNVTGNWTNDGAYNGATETVTFNGSAAQSIGGANASSFNSIELNNTAGVSLASNQNVNGNLGLTGNDLTTGANVLTQPNSGTSSGNFDVVGNVRRTGFLLGDFSEFGNPNNRITFTAGTPPTDVTVNLVKASPSGAMGFPNSVDRTYTITPGSAGPYTATLRLHYLDSELNGSPPGEEALLDLWRFNGTTWQRFIKTGFDLADNWVENNMVTQFSPWTISATPLAPTVTHMRSLKATRYAEGTLVEWRTAFEADNLGFNLYREEGGRRTLVTPSPVAGSALIAGAAAMTAGNTYTWVDRDGGAKATYWLEDIDTNGQTTTHGPFTTRPAGRGTRLQTGHRALLLSQLGMPSDERGAQSQWMRSAWTEDEGKAANGGATADAQHNEQASRAGVKLSVRRAGWTRITRAELEAAGLSEKADPVRLQLYAEGVEQAIAVGEGEWRAGGGFVEFYGEGLDTPSTDTRVYWLVEGEVPGRRIRGPLAGAKPPRKEKNSSGAARSRAPFEDAAPEAFAAQTAPDGGVAESAKGVKPRPIPVPPVTATSFGYTVERRDRTIYFSSLLNGEAENFFGRVVNATQGTQLLTVRDLDATAPELSELEVSLQGVTVTPHEVRVRFNGTELGALSFTGRERKAASFPLNPSALREGDNEVQLVSGAQSDVSLTDYIRLTYMRRYRAEADTLRFPASGGSTVRVGGFTTKDIRVLDVTDPSSVEELPLWIERDAKGGGFAASVTTRADVGSRTLLAFTGAGIARVAGATRNQPSTLGDATNGADLVLITHADFRDALAPLVERREREGLAVKVVDVEDIFDEFSYGAHTPQAVKDFLAAAHGGWQRAPRYVLLVGDGSYDPRDRMGRGMFDFVPAKLVDATHTEAVSDDWYADFDGDDLADMAVGRLPVRTPAEAALVVGKIAGYDPSGARQAAVTVADRAGSDGYDFEAATSSVEMLLPDTVAVERVNRGARPASDVRAEITARISAGPRLVNYMGHGSVNVWTGDGLLRNEDAAALTNGDRLSFFVLMTCLNGYYADPTLDALGEALLKAEGGGAVAVWASTGLTEPEAQAAMNRELYRQLFQSKEPLTLGEAVRGAKTATTNADVRRTWVLIGDPATRLR